MPAVLADKSFRNGEPLASVQGTGVSGGNDLSNGVSKQFEFVDPNDSSRTLIVEGVTVQKISSTSINFRLEFSTSSSLTAAGHCAYVLKSDGEAYGPPGACSTVTIITDADATYGTDFIISGWR